MTNVQSMNYGELKAKAKELGMENPTGKSKADLIEFINQTQGGIEMNTENTVVENAVEAAEVTEVIAESTGVTEEATETPEVETEEVVEVTSETPAAPVNEAEVSLIDQEEDVTAGPVQQRGQKWHEVEGAYPYVAGDHIEIVQVEPKQILVGRYLEVTQPSRARNALKGFLINPKTGEKQGTEITVHFDRIVKRTPDEFAAYLEAEKQQDAAKEAERAAKREAEKAEREAKKAEKEAEKAAKAAAAQAAAAVEVTTEVEEVTTEVPEVEVTPVEETPAV